MSKFRQLSRFTHTSDLGELTPRFKFGFHFSKADPGDLLLTLPFKRHWGFILSCAAMFVGLAAPLVIVSANMIGSLDGSLFSALFSLFNLFWVLGWSVGVGVVGLVLLLLLLGRETLHANADSLTLRVGIPGLGFGAEYQARGLRGFRFRQADKSTGSQWRGDHLCFDYVNDSIGFGSNIKVEQGRQIISRLQSLYPQWATADHDMATARPEVLPVAPGSDGLQSAAALKNSSRISTMTEPGQAIAGVPASASLVSPSTILLILVNLIPVAGVLLFDWSIAEIMLLFWAESGIIGFYNLLKMWKVGGAAVLVMGPFFIAHFGGFMVGHLLFIYGFFIDGLATQSISETATTAEMLSDMWALMPALVGYFISHGVSYVMNFLAKREYRGRTISQQMGEPYKRIIVMHITIIFGGFLAMALNSTLPVLLLLIAIKLASDIAAHVKEHRSKVTAVSGDN